MPGPAIHVPQNLPPELAEIVQFAKSVRANLEWIKARLPQEINAPQRENAQNMVTRLQLDGNKLRVFEESIVGDFVNAGSERQMKVIDLSGLTGTGGGDTINNTYSDAVPQWQAFDSDE